MSQFFSIKKHNRLNEYSNTKVTRIYPDFIKSDDLFFSYPNFVLNDGKNHNVQEYVHPISNNQIINYEIIYNDNENNIENKEKCEQIKSSRNFFSRKGSEMDQPFNNYQSNLHYSNFTHSPQKEIVCPLENLRKIDFS